MPIYCVWVHTHSQWPPAPSITIPQPDQNGKIQNTNISRTTTTTTKKARNYQRYESEAHKWKSQQTNKYWPKKNENNSIQIYYCMRNENASVTIILYRQKTGDFFPACEWLHKSIRVKYQIRMNQTNNNNIAIAKNHTIVEYLLRWHRVRGSNQWYHLSLYRISHSWPQTFRFVQCAPPCASICRKLGRKKRNILYANDDHNNKSGPIKMKSRKRWTANVVVAKWHSKLLRKKKELCSPH